MVSPRLLNPAVPSAYASALVDLGTTLRERKRRAEAEPLLRGALERVKQWSGEDSLESSSAAAQLSLGLIPQEKYRDLEPLARRCVEIRQREIPDSWLAYNARLILGCSLQGQKKHEEAERWLLPGYHGVKEREDQIPVQGLPQLREALRALVQLYEETDRPDEAARWRRQLAELEGAGEHPGHGWRGHWRVSLGGSETPPDDLPPRSSCGR